MRITRRVLYVLGLAAAIAIVRWRRRARSAPAKARVRGAPGIAGIAEVDPEPMTQIAGEGIDRDANRAAHEDVAEQRAKLPRPGENLP